MKRSFWGIDKILVCLLALILIRTEITSKPILPKAFFIPIIFLLLIFLFYLKPSYKGVLEKIKERVEEIEESKIKGKIKISKFTSVLEK